MPSFVFSEFLSYLNKSKSEFLFTNPYLAASLIVRSIFRKNNLQVVILLLIYSLECCKCFVDNVIYNTLYIIKIFHNYLF